MCNNTGCEKKEVAVILDAEGYTGRLSEPGRIVVYGRDGCFWDIAREMEFALDLSRGLPELRRKTADLTDFLGNCKIFAAKFASGAMFFELEKAGCTIWEVSGKPAEFLDGILEEEEENEMAGTQTGFEIPAPLEISPNNFTISIKEIQGKIPGISSKKILQQFIRGGDFDSLEITCDHVPPWIELDAVRAGMMMETEKIDYNEYLVKLMP